MQRGQARLPDCTTLKALHLISGAEKNWLVSDFQGLNYWGCIDFKSGFMIYVKTRDKKAVLELKHAYLCVLHVAVKGHAQAVSLNLALVQAVMMLGLRHRQFTRAGPPSSLRGL